MGWRQPGHLTHRPSVRTFLVPASGPFSAAGPPASEEYSPSSRLNHDIPNPIVNGWRDRSGGGCSIVPCICNCRETRSPKHLIDSRKQSLRIAAIVLVIGSKGEAERGLFNVNAIQQGQRWWDENDSKAGPVARMKSAGEDNELEPEIGGMADEAI